MDECFGPIAIALVVGDLAEAARLLDLDPSLATRSSSSGHPTLLQLVACEEPNIVDPLGAAQLLIDRGATTAGPFVAAAGCDARQVLGLLLDRGEDPNGEGEWTPLDEAIYWDNTETAQTLLDHGAQVKRLRSAAGLGDVTATAGFFEAGQLRVDAGPVASPFPETIPAALASDRQSIIDHAFVMAVNAGHRATAELLVERGAAVNAKPPGYHWHGTALHAACWRGDADLVAWLLAIGADPSVRDGLVEADALGWAKHHEHPHLFGLLVA